MTRVIGLGPLLWQTPPMGSPTPLVVDVRGLEPPQPMIRILKLLDGLASGQRLVVIHERRPMLLHPQLEERGFSHETEELGPDKYRITIWREG